MLVQLPGSTRAACVVIHIVIERFIGRHVRIFKIPYVLVYCFCAVYITRFVFKVLTHIYMDNKPSPSYVPRDMCASRWSDKSGQ